MSGGGKSQTSTSSVSIPPEILARYNAVNTRAEATGQIPFQPYTGEFVAPLSQTQQAGIANINQAAGMAQPYYQAAGSAITGSAAQAQPYYQSATNQVYGGLAAAQPYQTAATGYTMGAGAAAQPLQNQALSSLAAGQAQAQPLQMGSIGTMQQGAAASSPYIQRAGEAGLAGVSSAMGTQQQALSSLGAAAQAASPYYQATQQSMTGATLANQPFANLAAAGYAGAQGAASPYQQAASANLFGAQAGAQPLQGQAAQDVTNALGGAQPYQQMATQLGLAGGRQISPEELATEKYMSPYMKNVVESTMQNLRQQQQQEQSQILGSQIASGAFGGDRGRIAQANLARQQGMATGQTVSGLLNQGYGQALAAAQQQQGVALGAEQANRAAQAQAAQQMAALGQQGFGQNLAASQQRAALGQQGFGQALATAQQQAALGQQLYGQQMGVAQAQQGLGQQGFAQNMAQAQMNQALAQQMYSQGANTAQVQAAIAQQQANQGMQLGQLQAGLGAQTFGQAAQIGQQQANVGQALFGQGATAAQQQAALAQQAYAQQMGQGQQLAALGQQGFGQNLAAAQQLQGLGQGLFGIGSGVSQGLTGIGGAAQQAALQGGQAQLGAGTVEQQTQQALNQANYNQFLQQQGYPYQVAQFLANIAMGTGALSGSTTTTTQPASFFSDKRLKDDIEPIGKTYDGQEIVRYRYKGEPATRIGLVAQDVEKKHPEAVGLAGGFKTVDYDKATDDAAARAPKAYGGGLNPWTDASMGGSVFREDAGRGYAVGGAPGGDDILAQINALVNAHQGMFPYGKAGMYGSGMGKAGPYGSTLMQSSNRQLMRADPVRQTPQYDVRQAMRDVKDIQEMPKTISQTYSGLKRGLLGAPESTSQTTSPGGQTTTQTTPASGGLFGSRGQLQWEGSWGQQLADAMGMANGGGIRQGLAAGGLPYSSAEDEYVPEDISAPIKPAGLQPAKPPPPGRTTGDDIMTMIKLAAMAGGGGFASGGLVPRQGYQAGGNPEENVNVPEGYLDFVGQRESGNRPDATNPLFPPERGGPVGRHQFTRDTWLELARNDPRFEGKNEQEILAARTDPTVSSLYALRYGQQNAPILQRAGLDITSQNLFLAHNQGGRGATALLQNPDRNVVDVLTDVYGNRDRALAVVNSNRGNPDMTASQFAANLTGARPQATGVAPPNAQGAGTAPQAQQQGVVPPGYAPPRPLPAREPPDWMERNQTWMLPLLTGLGTMASSPSRYLGSAVLQGLMGAGQGYQQALSGELQRRQQEATYEKTREEQGLVRAQAEKVIAEIQRGAIDPNTGTVNYLRPDGTYGIMRLGEYFRRIRAGEIIFTAPGRPGLEQPQPQAPGQPQGAQPQTQAQPAETRLPPALQQHAADTARMLVDSTNYRGNLNTSSEMTGTARDIFAVAERSGSTASQNRPDRNAYISSLASVAQSGGLTGAGQMGAVTAPLVAWYNSIIDAMPLSAQAKAEARLEPDKIADRQVIDKITSVLSMQRESEAGQRSLGALRVALQATPTALNSPEGIARLGAAYLVDNQRAIDFEDFAKRYRANLMRPENEFDAALLPLAGQNAGLASLFDREYGDRFGIEKKILENMMLAKVPVQQQVTRDGRQVTETVDVPLVKVISESGGNVPENVRRFMMQHYVNERAGITPEIVNGVFRYFLAQGRR